MIDLGNVNLVGMSLDEGRAISSNYGSTTTARSGCCRRTSSTIRSGRSASARPHPTGYSGLGAPTGRYFAPAGPVPTASEVDTPPAGGQRTSEPRETGVFGDCGTGELVATGPLFKSFDISVLKRIAIAGRVNADIRFEVLNAFNNVNFVPVGGIGAQSGAYEVLALTGTQTARTTQIVFRVNW